MLLRSTPSRDFTDLQLPLTAVAADVMTGHHVELNSGDLISALMASTAIPGSSRLSSATVCVSSTVESSTTFRSASPPHRGQDDRCARLRLQPVRAAHRADAAAFLLRAAAIMASSQVRRDLALCADRTVLYVPGKWPPASMPYDFSKSYENSTESHEIAMDWLEGLTIKGRGLYGEPPDVTRTES